MRPSRIEMPGSVAEAILQAARRSSPEECCGFLFGTLDGTIARVTLAVAARNVAASHRTARYEIAPQEFVRAMGEQEPQGREFLGFYHSHPGLAPVPSEIDRRQPWPETLYAIARARDGGDEIRFWWFDGGLGAFCEIH